MPAFGRRSKTQTLTQTFRGSQHFDEWEAPWSPTVFNAYILTVNVFFAIRGGADVLWHSGEKKTYRVQQNDNSMQSKSGFSVCNESLGYAHAYVISVRFFFTNIDWQRILQCWHQILLSSSRLRAIFRLSFTLLSTNFRALVFIMFVNRHYCTLYSGCGMFA